ncbi:MAG: OPT/YSL family transporter [Paludibaculum sp.]
MRLNSSRDPSWKRTSPAPSVAIGESVAAGAIFTIPAFVIVKSWTRFDSFEAYWQSSVLMLVGGTLGILFVTLLRRVMVEDPELPYPESFAAAEIHKAGQRGSDAASTLFSARTWGSAALPICWVN